MKVTYSAVPGQAVRLARSHFKIALICYIARCDPQAATLFVSEYRSDDPNLLQAVTCDAGRQLQVEARRQAAGAQWIDIDSADAENPMACTDYVASIMEHLFQSEVRSALLSCPLLEPWV